VSSEIVANVTLLGVRGKSALIFSVWAAAVKCGRKNRIVGITRLGVSSGPEQGVEKAGQDFISEITSL